MGGPGDSLFVHEGVAVGTPPEGEAVQLEPWTTKSRRTVPMLNGLSNALLARQERQRSVNHDLGGFVSTDTDGRMLRPWTFSRRDLDRTLERAGITKKVTLYSHRHTLRHTLATLHVVAGTPSNVVSDALGHANIQQTANPYQHAAPGVTADWMQRFEQAQSAAARETMGAPS